MVSGTILFLTFLTSILMTVATLHVVPLITVLYTKCMNTIFISKVVRLILGPSGEIARTTIYPNEVTLCWFVVQSQPWLLSIMSMLDEYVFLIVVYINQNRVFSAAFCQCCCPVGAFFTRQIAETVEIAPSWITYICTKRASFCYVSFVLYWNGCSIHFIAFWNVLFLFLSFGLCLCFRFFYCVVIPTTRKD